LKNNIYVPCNNADGSEALITGLITRAWKVNEFDKIVIIGYGGRDYYKEMLPNEIAEHMVFFDLDDFSKKEKTIEELKHFSQDNTDYLYVFYCPAFDPEPITRNLNKVIFQDYRCSFVANINSDWDVFLPPLFDFNSWHMLEAFDRNNVEIIKIGMFYKVRKSIKKLEILTQLTTKKRASLLSECFLIGSVVAVLFLVAVIEKSVFFGLLTILAVTSGFKPFNQRFSKLLHLKN
jgi:hypothetical protein